MNDVFGTEIKVGDEVACNGYGRRGLVLGTVAKITPKQVKIIGAVPLRSYLRPPGEIAVKPKPPVTNTTAIRVTISK